MILTLVFAVLMRPITTASDNIDITGVCDDAVDSRYEDYAYIEAIAEGYCGVSRDVYDCSAYVQQVYADYGISVPRVTYDQADCGERIYTRDLSDLKPGDIICFGSDKNNITHVGIYDGSGNVLHSSYSSWCIKFDDLYQWINSGQYNPPYQFAVRVIS